MLIRKKMLLAATIAVLLPCFNPALAPAQPILAQLMPEPVFTPPRMPLPITPVTVRPWQSSSKVDEAIVEAHVMVMLGLKYEGSGDISNAISMYKQVRELAPKIKVPNEDLAAAAGHLGALYSQSKLYKTGLLYSQTSLAEFQHMKDVPASTLAVEYNNIAWTLEQLKRFKEAEDAYCLSLSNLYLAESDNTDLIGMSENNYADFLADHGRGREALVHYQLSYAHMKQALGPDHELTKLVGKKLLRAMKREI